MTILLFPIFAFGLVLSWVVYLGIQQANECAQSLQRVRANEKRPERIRDEELKTVPDRLP